MNYQEGRVLNSPGERKYDAKDMKKVRCALVKLPLFDGERETLSRYIAGLKEGLDLVGPELHELLLYFAKVRISNQAVQAKIFSVHVPTIQQYTDFLKITYDPPSGVYELVDELRRIARRTNDSVEDFERRVQYLADKIVEASVREDMTEKVTKTWVQQLALQCFRNGLMGLEKFDESNVAKFAIDRPNFRAISVSTETRDQTALVSTNAAGGSREADSTKRNVENSETTVSVKRIKLEAAVKTETCENVAIWREPAVDHRRSAGSSSGTIVCNLCRKRGHAADVCRSAGRSRENHRSSIICDSCGKIGHSAERCFPNPCGSCGRKGHPTDKCRSSRAIPLMGNQPILKMRPYNSDKKREERCTKCNEWGHASKDCVAIHNARIYGTSDSETILFSPSSTGFDNSPDQVSSTVEPSSYPRTSARTLYADNKCRYCKEEGHFVADCPRIAKNNRH